MIIDARQGEMNLEMNGDLCLVGAGAIGLAIANDLRSSGLKVILVESGGMRDCGKTQDLYRSEVTGLPFSSSIGGRFRILGGSTTRWGGQSLPLDPGDFEKRDWIENSGWPLTYSEVAQFYDRANEYLDVDLLDYGPGLANELNLPWPSFSGSGVRYHFSKWAREPDLRRIYFDRLKRAANTTIILHANLTDIRLEDDRATSIVLRTLEGRESVVGARAFVLCCGGIECARLLLACRRQRGSGIGNETGWVGKCLMEHPAANLGTIEADPPNRTQELFNGARRNGRKFSMRISLDYEKQKEMRLVNASAGFIFRCREDSGFGCVRALLQTTRASPRPSLSKAVWEGIKAFPQVAAAGKALWIDGRVFTPGAECEVVGSFEQEPCWASHVDLADDKDALGVPRSRIHWRLNEKTLYTARAFADLLDAALRRAGIGRLRKAPLLLEAEDPNDSGLFGDQNHHMGTTRMAATAAGGVVDTNLAVFSVPNLYVASSSVFPTGGHSNPTLTSLALAMRLADHLKEVLRERS